MKNIFAKGFTILETMIAISIMLILFSVTLPQFSKIKENQVFKNAVLEVVSSLDKARSETLASLNSSEYGVHFESDRVIIFKGKVYVSGTTSNEIISIITPASISNVTLGGVSSTSGEMYFNRLSGSPSATGTITISSPTFTKIVTISATGGASSN